MSENVADKHSSSENPLDYVRKKFYAVLFYLLCSVKFVSDVSVRWLGQWYWWVAARVWITLSADNSSHVTVLLVILEMCLTVSVVIGISCSNAAMCLDEVWCFAIPCLPVLFHLELRKQHATQTAPLFVYFWKVWCSQNLNFFKREDFCLLFILHAWIYVTKNNKVSGLFFVHFVECMSILWHYHRRVSIKVVG